MAHAPLDYPCTHTHIHTHACMHIHIALTVNGLIPYTQPIVSDRIR